MNTISEPQWIGIDVSQANLDIALRPAGSTWQVNNTDSGWQKLLTQLSEIAVVLVVVESTGGLERGVVPVLQRQAMPVAVINPKRARDFSKASGHFAKTDRIDAEMLAILVKRCKRYRSPWRPKHRRRYRIWSTAGSRS